MIDYTCVLFAGGKSSRMGRDKALLPFGTYSTLSEFQYARLKKIFTRVIISAKTAEKFPFASEVITDPDTTEFAPTAGFVAAFEALDSDSFFALSVDTPFVGIEEIKALLSADNGACDAVIARTPEGSHPLCGIYHRTLQNDFSEMFTCKNHRLGALLKKSRTCYVDFNDEAPFANLNHPHEYEEAHQKIITPK